MSQALPDNCLTCCNNKQKGVGSVVILFSTTDPGNSLETEAGGSLLSVCRSLACKPLSTFVRHLLQISWGNLLNDVSNHAGFNPQRDKKC